MSTLLLSPCGHYWGNVYSCYSVTKENNMYIQLFVQYHFQVFAGTFNRSGLSGIVTSTEGIVLTLISGQTETCKSWNCRGKYGNESDLCGMPTYHKGMLEVYKATLMPNWKKHDFVSKFAGRIEDITLWFYQKNDQIKPLDWSSASLKKRFFQFKVCQQVTIV